MFPLELLISVNYQFMHFEKSDVQPQRKHAHHLSKQKCN